MFIETPFYEKKKLLSAASVNHIGFSGHNRPREKPLSGIKLIYIEQTANSS